MSWIMQHTKISNDLLCASCPCHVAEVWNGVLATLYTEMDRWHRIVVFPWRQTAERIIRRGIINPNDTLRSTSDIELMVNSTEKSGPACPMLVGTSKSVPFVPSINHPLHEAEPAFQPPIIPKASKLIKRRYQLLQTDLINTVSYCSRNLVPVRLNH